MVESASHEPRHRGPARQPASGRTRGAGPRAVPNAAVAPDGATAEAGDGPGTGMPVDRMDERDLVVSIGGDGTVLFAARDAGTTPML